MKTKNFGWVMAAAAILTGMVGATSCSKSEEALEPVVVDSEFVSSGCDDSVTESSGTEGTSFSYQSWIRVKQTTRAIVDDTIKVALFSRFNNVVDEAEVATFNFGEPKVDISYRAVDSRVDQRFVTVTDSVLVYRLQYENDFALEYELLYEVPTYYDGVKTWPMPYIKIGAIVDNGLTVSGMDNVVIDGKTYFRKLVRHSISVIFNDKTYEVFSSVVCRSPQAPEDTLLDSRKVGEGMEMVSFDKQTLEGVYKVWLEIEQQWSESGKKTVKKEVVLHHQVQYPMIQEIVEVNHEYDVLDDFVLTTTDYGITSQYGEIADNVAVDTYAWKQELFACKGDDESVQKRASITYIDERARYTDEKLACDFPCPQFTDMTANYQLVHGWEPFADDGVSYERAEYKFNFGAKYGDAVYAYKLTWYLAYYGEEQR